MVNQSALSPAPFRPTWEIGAAIGVHLALILGVWLGGMFEKSAEPLFKPEVVMEVQAVSLLPRSTTSVPQRRERTPDPVRGAKTPEAPPVPPTASEMVKNTPEAKSKGQTQAPNLRDTREKLLNKARAAAILKDMTAAVGETNRTETAKDGVNPDEAILGPIGAGRLPADLARWHNLCKQRLHANWTPLPSIISAHPEYLTRVKVDFKASGTTSNPRVVQGSGDIGYDRAAVLAFLKTGPLPPPPARYAAQAERFGLTFTFPARDKR